jgi:ABC-type transport system involved in multi-copper enzyme maturation permease subunit
MRPFLALTRTTLRQLLGGRRLLILLPLATIPGLVMLLGTRDMTASDTFRFFHEAPIAIVYLIVVPIASLVLGAAALGDERRDGTLSFIALRPVRRTTITGAKLLAACLAAGVVGGVAAALPAVVLGSSTGDWGPMAPMILGAVLSIAAYSAAFLVLGHLTQRAVLIGLVYVFIWESGITNIAEGLANVSLFRIGLSGYAGMVDGAPRLLAEPLGALTPGMGGALAKAAVIAAVAIAFAAWLLRTRDLAAEAG